MGVGLPLMVNEKMKTLLIMKAVVKSRTLSNLGGADNVLIKGWPHFWLGGGGIGKLTLGYFQVTILGWPPFQGSQLEGVHCANCIVDMSQIYSAHH